MGFYARVDGSCGACVAPNHTVFVGRGRAVGVASSCNYTCDKGYYPQTLMGTKVVIVCVW